MASNNLSRPTTDRVGPHLLDKNGAVCVLDEAIGALTLAYETVEKESGTNQALAHAFCSMRLAIVRLDELRNTLAEAREVANG
jgi:hypothetical protein